MRLKSFLIFKTWKVHLLKITIQFENLISSKYKYNLLIVIKINYQIPDHPGGSLLSFKQVSGAAE